MSEPRLTPEYAVIDLGNEEAVVVALTRTGSDPEQTPHERAILKLRAALSDRDRQLAELREACQPLIAAATPEVYTSVRCVMVHDLNRLAALLPPPAKEEPRAETK